MPYDATLDKSLFSKSWENDMTRLTVSVMQYNEGAKKLQISRENLSAEGEAKFAKLGRMTKDEIVAVLPHIQEAIPHMEA